MDAQSGEFFEQFKTVTERVVAQLGAVESFVNRMADRIDTQLTDIFGEAQAASETADEAMSHRTPQIAPCRKSKRNWQMLGRIFLSYDSFYFR